MKKWIVQLQDNSVHVIGSITAPSSPDYKVVLEAPGDPDFDEGSIYDIEEIDDGFGGKTYRAVINNGRRNQLRAQKQNAKNQSDARNNQIKQKKDEIRAYKDADLQSVDDIRAALFKVLEVLNLR